MNMSTSGTSRSRRRAGLFLAAILVFGVAGYAAFLASSGTARNPQPHVVSHEAMKWIPAGEFDMGSNDPDSQPNEHPIHRVKVDAFWIDVHDVTNAEFARFVHATGYVTTAEKPVDWEELRQQVPPGTPKPPPEMLLPGSLVYTPTDHEVPLNNLQLWWRWVPGASWKHPDGPSSNISGKDDYPVVQVSWDDAVAYAQWAGKRLPTEAEWEYAARGGLSGKKFVWGDDFKPADKFMANTFTGQFPVKDTAEDGFAGTSPWNAFPPNGYGLYDMAGNVWQWTADPYRDTNADGICPLCSPASPVTSSAVAMGEVRRVIKGGSYLCSYVYCESYRPSARRGTPRDTGSGHVGFRCVTSR
jgi:formylglycine-generating enzyme